MYWLLFKGRNVCSIQLNDPIRHLKVIFTYGHCGCGTMLGVEIQHVVEPNLGQQITIHHNEGLTRSLRQQGERASSTKPLVLVQVGDINPPLTTIAKVVAD